MIKQYLGNKKVKRTLRNIEEIHLNSVDFTLYKIIANTSMNEIWLSAL